MTKEDFLKESGADWRKFAGKPMFSALMMCINRCSPAKEPPAAEGDKLHGAPVYLNQIYGWEKLVTFIESLSTEPDKSFEPQDTFKKEETI